MASSSEISVPEVPVHPTTSFAFPRREFGKKTVVKRSCQASQLFQDMVLVDLRSKQRDVVLCHKCASAVLAKKLGRTNQQLLPPGDLRRGVPRLGGNMIVDVKLICVQPGLKYVQFLKFRCVDSRNSAVVDVILDICTFLKCCSCCPACTHAPP